MDFFDKIKKKKKKIPDIKKINGFCSLRVVIIANYNHEIAELLWYLKKTINLWEIELLEKLT